MLGRILEVLQLPKKVENISGLLVLQVSISL